VAKRKWWQYLLFFVRAAADEVESGNIGAGKKTAKGGEIVGKALDGVIEATDDQNSPA